MLVKSSFVVGETGETPIFLGHSLVKSTLSITRFHVSLSQKTPPSSDSRPAQAAQGWAFAAPCVPQTWGIIPKRCKRSSQDRGYLHIIYIYIYIFTSYFQVVKLLMVGVAIDYIKYSTASWFSRFILRWRISILPTITPWINCHEFSTLSDKHQWFMGIQMDSDMH